jgi:hypothetical protein
LIIKS